jgi:C_GCAxxG_C_C family probable redox protein
MKMDTQSLIEKRVHTYYWDNKYNCAITTLKILSERFNIQLQSQVIDSAVGMHGAGGYRAQCGLVEGALMFLGILDRTRNQTNEEIDNHCQEYARQFEARFGSLLCRELRPEGFLPDQPPHLCEPLTRQAIAFDIEYITVLLSE